MGNSNWGINPMLQVVWCVSAHVCVFRAAGGSFASHSQLKHFAARGARELLKAFEWEACGPFISIPHDAQKHRHFLDRRRIQRYGLNRRLFPPRLHHSPRAVLVAGQNERWRMKTMPKRTPPPPAFIHLWAGWRACVKGVMTPCMRAFGMHTTKSASKPG